MSNHSLNIVAQFGEFVQKKIRLKLLNKKNTARLLRDTPPLAPSKQMFQQLKWLPLDQIVKF